jgi:hypothetical protein
MLRSMRMSTRTHGILDYVTGAALVVVPGFMNCTARTRALLRLAGAGAAVYSMFTRYERGVVKALPIKAHLALDAMSGATLIAAAGMMEDEDPAVRTAVAGIGLFEIAAAAMTEPRSSLDIQQQGRREHEQIAGERETPQDAAASFPEQTSMPQAVPQTLM